MSETIESKPYVRVDRTMPAESTYGLKEFGIGFGKGVFNVARFVVTKALPVIAEGAAKKILENNDATPEQQEKARQTLTNADMMHKKFKTGIYDPNFEKKGSSYPFGYDYEYIGGDPEKPTSWKRKKV